MTDDLCVAQKESQSIKLLAQGSLKCGRKYHFSLLRLLLIHED